MNLMTDGTISYIQPFLAALVLLVTAELGDKTQIMTISFAARYNKPFQIWLGATLGMGLANIFGIAVGNRLGAALPEKTVKRTAGLLFIAFGLLTLGDFIINSLC